MANQLPSMSGGVIEVPRCKKYYRLSYPTGAWAEWSMAKIAKVFPTREAARTQLKKMQKSIRGWFQERARVIHTRDLV